MSKTGPSGALPARGRPTLALKRSRASWAWRKCSLRLLSRTLLPGSTTVASSQKLATTVWRSVRAAISSKPSKISSSRPIRLSTCTTSELPTLILCLLKKNSANRPCTVVCLA